MKHYLKLSLLATLLCLVPFSVAFADSNPHKHKFGVATNAAMNGQVLPLRLITTGTYSHGLNQFELGLGIHPLIRQELGLISADFNYKVFPNGRSNKFNLYLMGNLTYISTRRETFFPTTFNYLFLHAGYGIELSATGGFYLDTNVSFGGFTYSKISENPASSFLDAQRLFEDFGTSINLQIGAGCRF
ncbi:hypothetical protein [Reinekea sp.]|jgi:hypothetical protein|uniref:hypothetical protein n=1 Tax=Reinekea sp. TaxID=1970455 RepID=UPI003988A27C